MLHLFPARRVQLHTRYDDKFGLFRTGPARAAVIAGLVALAAFPFFATNRWLIVAIGTGAVLIGALGLQLLIGITGQISLGHATFLAIGYYSVIALSPGTFGWVDTLLGNLPVPLSWMFGNAAGWPLFFGLLFAGAMAALVGVLLGPTALRLKGLYLAIVTMGLVFLGEHVFLNWRSLTGGPQGRAYTAPAIGEFSFAQPGTVLGVDLSALQRQYFLVTVLALLALLAVGNLLRSRTGRALQAIRDRDVAAAVIGVPVARYKIQSFAASSFMAGVAGALYGMAILHAVPESWDLFLSIKFVAMVVIGGAGAFGALLGVLFVEITPVFLRNVVGFQVAAMTPFQFQAILYGLFIIVFLVWEPSGLAGLWAKARRYLRSWPFTY